MGDLNGSAPKVSSPAGAVKENVGPGAAGPTVEIDLRAGVKDFPQHEWIAAPTAPD